MLIKNFKKFILVSVLIFNSSAHAADDVAEMAGISVGAGAAAGAAVSQLSSDAGLVSANITSSIKSLGAATTEIGAKLDVSIAQAQKAMAFAESSLAAGDLTAAMQTMSLVEGVTDMALGAIPSPVGLDMAGINFKEDFSPAEMAALSSIAGQMGVGQVMAVQKMAGQMAAVEGAGFDAKGMMGALDGQGIGIGTAMQGLASAGMVDMAASTGAATFNMDTFSPENFASMNVAEMGMSPSMMAGALDALPVGAATAALETLQGNPEGFSTGFGAMSGTMTGAIGASMATKGMGAEMMGNMGASIGVDGLGAAATGMKGMAGMETMGEAMASMGMEAVGASLSTAFSTPATGITSTLSGTVGMISGAISGKAPKGQTAVQAGSVEGSLAAGMSDAGPAALEMPENISEAGMMMGAMIMAKPSLAGGLPGAMAPPENMMASGIAAGKGIGTGSGAAMGGVSYSGGDMNEAM
ncbi:hypothetical protein N9K18_02590, partial [Candidatus Pelagibacter sp.]|nr:hypothetical protein [Candidatus Pelagibacter sp.]